MSAASNVAEPAKDECYRCGYDLRGINNDAPCPECGLLAERSRRVSDELHDTRPKWLRKLSRGINFILLAVLAIFLWPFFSVWLDSYFAANHWPAGNEHYYLIGPDLAVLLLTIGLIHLTEAEGYPPADRADYKLRMSLRAFAALPPCAMFAVHLLVATYPSMVNLPYLRIWIVGICLALSTSFLPLFLFLRLRSLAIRTRSVDMPEHCLIVGIGGMLAILYGTVVVTIGDNPATFGLNSDWMIRSNTAQILMLFVPVMLSLFGLWGLLLLIRFAVALWKASRALNRKWSRDDRSLESPSA